MNIFITRAVSAGFVVGHSAVDINALDGVSLAFKHGDKFIVIVI